MFVVTNQHALWVSGQSGFTGAGQAKEDGRVDRVANRMVRRTVHRHDVLAGQDVVKQGENGFLVLTGIFGVGDQDGFLVEIHRDHSVGPTAVLFWVRLERRAVDDCPIGDKRVQIFTIWAAQHMADEQVVPSQLGHNTHVDGIGRVGTAYQILNVVVLALHMLDHIGMQSIKAFGRHRGVVFPPDAVGNTVCLDDEFVLGGTAGELAGGHKERTALAQAAFASFQSRFDQSGLHEVVIDIAQPFDPLIFEAELRVYPSKCHLRSSCSALSCKILAAEGRNMTAP